METEKVSKNLHLVAGKHEHNITHSVTPISASEIEKLEALNPQYVDRLFNIVEKSLEIEDKEMNRYFNTIEQEQSNDELAIISKDNMTTKSLQYATAITIFLIIAALVFTYFGFEYIAYIIVSVVIIAIIKGIFSGSSSKDKDPT